MARTVYSTGKGRLCPTCSAPVDMCRCKQVRNKVPEGDGIVRIRRETKGRKGKTVTTVTGLVGSEKEIKAIAKVLKQKCGVGGSVKDWVVVIQGDKVDTVVDVLRKKGLTVKVSGG